LKERNMYRIIAQIIAYERIMIEHSKEILSISNRRVESDRSTSLNTEGYDIHWIVYRKAV